MNSELVFIYLFIYWCICLFVYLVDANFSWANAGAAVFGGITTRNEDEEDDSGDDSSNNPDIHFEPIVSLPEVGLA